MSTGDVAVGAASGAMQGAAVAGPVGAIIGGIAGAIGGIFKSKSKKAARKAQAVQQQMDDIQNAALRRNQLREAFIARQTAIAAGAAESGGLQSSTVQGAVAGIESQYAYNARYFDTQLANVNTFNKFSKKAAKFQDYAGAALNLGSAAISVAARLPQTSERQAVGRRATSYGMAGQAYMDSIMSNTTGVPTAPFPYKR